MPIPVAPPKHPTPAKGIYAARPPLETQLSEPHNPGCPQSHYKEMVTGPQISHEMSTRRYNPSEACQHTFAALPTPWPHAAAILLWHVHTPLQPFQHHVPTPLEPFSSRSTQLCNPSNTMLSRCDNPLNYCQPIFATLSALCIMWSLTATLSSID